MSQTLLQIGIIGLVALGLVLYIIDPTYVLIMVKFIFTLINIIFATFVFIHLMDMNNHYKSRVYSIFFLLNVGILGILVLILLGLFL